MREKSRELRMRAVAARPPAQHGARQERLPPRGDETRRIEMPRVKGPETHSAGKFSLTCPREARENFALNAVRLRGPHVEDAYVGQTSNTRLHLR